MPTTQRVEALKSLILHLSLIVPLLAAIGYAHKVCAQESGPATKTTDEAPPPPPEPPPPVPDPKIAAALQQANAQFALGKKLKEQGKFSEAATAFASAAKAFTEGNKSVDAAWVFGWIGDCHRDAKDNEAAVAAYQKSVTRFQAIKDKEASAEGLCLNARDLGMALVRLSKHSDAIPYLKLSAESFGALNQSDSVNAAWAHSYLGGCYRDIGEDSKAVAAYASSALIFQQHEHWIGLADVAPELAAARFRLKQYSKAAPTFALAAEAYDQTQQQEDAAWMFALIGECYREAKNDEAAAIAYERSLKRFQQIKASTYQVKGEVFNFQRLAILSEQRDDWASAIAYSEAAWKCRKVAMGKEHYQTIDARLAWERCKLLSTLTSVQLSKLARADQFIVRGAKAKRKEEYGIALGLYREGSKIQRNVLGEKHPEYAITLNNLAGLHKAMGDYAKAEPRYIKCRDIQEKVLGEKHPSYATTLNNLARLYVSMGDYGKAEPLYILCRDIQKEALGEKHPDYATTLNNLAWLYKTIGDYTKAEPLYDKCLDIQKKVLGDRHPSYASTLNNLASLYESTGDYAKAEQLYLQCQDIQKILDREQHPHYAGTLNNLAGLYESMGAYAKAEPLYIRCRDIQKQALGERHPHYANTLNSLAGLYESMGDYAKAEPLYIRCRDIQKEALGEKHPLYANTLNNLAGFYGSMGDYAKAEPLYVRCRDIQKEALGEEHPSHAATLGNLSLLYRSMGDYEKAVPLATTAVGQNLRHLEETSLILSERQQLAMNRMLRPQLDAYMSLALDAGNHYHAKAAKSVLTWKGATLVRQRAMRLAAGQPAIYAKFKQLQQATRQLTDLTRTQSEDDTDLWKLRKTSLTVGKERLEAELSRASSAFRLALQNISLEQIQAALPYDAVLIDYLQFRRFRPAHEQGQWDVATSLLAVVLKRGGEPELIELGPVAPLSEAIDTWRRTFGTSSQGKQAGLAIRQQIWEPLLEHISKAKTILVCADGVLGRLPLGALPGREPGSYLIEDHRLAMIPAPRLLPQLTQNPDSGALDGQVLLVGGIDYGVNDEGIDRPWQQLTGAEREVDTLARQYRGIRSNEDDVLILGGEAASKENILPSLANASIMHFATHGLFESRVERIAALLPESTRSRGATIAVQAHEFGHDGDDSGTVTITRTGLVLAGANLAVKQESSLESNDGILTDMEILTLPLQNAKLVVLSACDTGQGKLEGGEGILGIQRAFHVAGAKTTVASLWKVDDLATQRLMERFHSNLQQSEMTRLDALREAQLEILNNPKIIHGVTVKGQESTERVSPYYWAAFQLSGDWR